MKILLVEPDFHYPNKSKNQANNIHKNFYYPVIIKPSKGTNCEGMSIVQNEQEVRKAILKIKKHIYYTNSDNHNINN